ncbi:hypothetical protein PRZ48_014849 [Zasmidium cellare]|uniref:Uncharacterized protein n=1 Tax=Zasmidium cellare TaxID=395010 RepID=A0ABR0DX33_ZASCE|nr:hypothetical protein PRZ48_014849 [Zasmidium cellare]
MGLEENERRTFDYFLSCSAPRLGGTFDDNFWTGQVLQVAKDEPVILDTLLAISRLYEYPQCLSSSQADAQRDQMLLPEESVGTSALGTGRPEAYKRSSSADDLGPVLSQQHMLAVKHYNRAISRLVEDVASGRATLILALMSCVLFICVELLRDNMFAALNLFTKGCQILRQIEPSSASVDRGLYTPLKLAMARFGVLAAMYGHPDLLEGRPMDGEVSETARLENMSDARSALYVVILDSLEFHRAAIPWKSLLMRQLTQEHATPDGISSLDENDEVLPSFSSQSPSSSSTTGVETPTTTTSTPDTMQYKVSPSAFRPQCLTAEMPTDLDAPEVLQRLRTHYEARLLAWCHAMQNIEAKSDAMVSILMMYYLSCIILMASRLSVYESIHDDYTHHYEEIVRFAEIYYKSRSEQPNFTFEPGAVPILWMVATKCRVPSLRRKALSLIKKAPLKECMWARDSVVDFASRVIAIEEGLSSPSNYSGSHESSTPPSDGPLPPESSRIHDAEILTDVQSGQAGMRVTRYSNGLNGSWIRSVQFYPI